LKIKLSENLKDVAIWLSKDPKSEDEEKERPNKSTSYYYGRFISTIKLLLFSAFGGAIIACFYTDISYTLFIGIAFSVPIFTFAAYRLFTLKKENKNRLRINNVIDTCLVIALSLFLSKYQLNKDSDRLLLAHDMKSLASRIVYKMFGADDNLIEDAGTHTSVNSATDMWTIKEDCTYHIVRIQLKNPESPYDVRIADRSLSAAKKEGAVAAVNGGYLPELARYHAIDSDPFSVEKFNSTHAGLVKIDNVVVSEFFPDIAMSDRPIGEGIFGVTADGTPVIRKVPLTKKKKPILVRRISKGVEKFIYDVEPGGVEEITSDLTCAIQLGPILIWDGKVATKRNDEPSSWSFIGLTEEGALIMGTALAKFAGVTSSRTHSDVAKQLARWAEENNVKLTRAIACDGGGFAGLIAGDFSTQSFAPCPNSIWVVPKDEENSEEISNGAGPAIKQGSGEVNPGDTEGTTEEGEPTPPLKLSSRSLTGQAPTDSKQEKKPSPFYAFGHMPLGKFTISEYLEHIKFGVSRSTAHRGFTVLEKLGLVAIHRGSGGKPHEIICKIPKRLRPRILKILKAYKNKNDIPRILQELREIKSLKLIPKVSEDLRDISIEEIFGAGYVVELPEIPRGASVFYDTYLVEISNPRQPERGGHYYLDVFEEDGLIKIKHYFPNLPQNGRGYARTVLRWVLTRDNKWAEFEVVIHNTHRGMRRSFMKMKDFNPKSKALGRDSYELSGRVPRVLETTSRESLELEFKLISELPEDEVYDSGIARLIVTSDFWEKWSLEDWMRSGADALVAFHEGKPVGLWSFLEYPWKVALDNGVYVDKETRRRGVGTFLQEELLYRLKKRDAKRFQIGGKKRWGVRRTKEAQKLQERLEGRKGVTIHRGKKGKIKEVVIDLKAFEPRTSPGRKIKRKDEAALWDKTKRLSALVKDKLFQENEEYTLTAETKKYLGIIRELLKTNKKATVGEALSGKYGEEIKEAVHQLADEFIYYAHCGEDAEASPLEKDDVRVRAAIAFFGDTLGRQDIVEAILKRIDEERICGIKRIKGIPIRAHASERFGINLVITKDRVADAAALIHEIGAMLGLDHTLNEELENTYKPRRVVFMETVERLRGLLAEKVKTNGIEAEMIGTSWDVSRQDLAATREIDPTPTHDAARTTQREKTEGLEELKKLIRHKLSEEREGPVTIALKGRAGSGKTTVTQELRSWVRESGMSMVSLDPVFLGWGTWRKTTFAGAREKYPEMDFITFDIVDRMPPDVENIDIFVKLKLDDGTRRARLAERAKGSYPGILQWRRRLRRVRHDMRAQESPDPREPDIVIDMGDVGSQNEATSVPWHQGTENTGPVTNSEEISNGASDDNAGAVDYERVREILETGTPFGIIEETVFPYDTLSADGKARVDDNLRGLETSTKRMLEHESAEEEIAWEQKKYEKVFYPYKEEYFRKRDEFLKVRENYRAALDERNAETTESELERLALDLIAKTRELAQYIGRIVVLNNLHLRPKHYYIRKYGQIGILSDTDSRKFAISPSSGIDMLEQAESIEEGDTILDPFAGPGNLNILLATLCKAERIIASDIRYGYPENEGDKTYAIDKNLEGLRRIFDFLPAILRPELTNIQHGKGNAESIDMPDLSVDKIFTDPAYGREGERSEEPEAFITFLRAMREFHRVLKPDGQAFVLMPGEWAMFLSELVRSRRSGESPEDLYKRFFDAIRVSPYYKKRSETPTRKYDPDSWTEAQKIVEEILLGRSGFDMETIELRRTFFFPVVILKLSKRAEEPAGATDELSPDTGPITNSEEISNGTSTTIKQ
ncbi:MAG: GNAT family N-acetyltransferase, partial [Candidatus Omnitrophica bacterium]|nr:GNAT family N-acetyltransferase [Candidatus Omnitrophota bacterium]